MNYTEGKIRSDKYEFIEQLKSGTKKFNLFKEINMNNRTFIKILNYNLNKYKIIIGVFFNHSIIQSFNYSIRRNSRKNKGFLKYFILIFLGIIFNSCSDWLDINKNPNVPEDVGFEELLPSGISSAAYVIGGRYQVLGALWSQHWTQSPGASQYAGIDSYDINSSTFDDNQFGELYSGALQNLEEIRLKSYNQHQWHYFLVATVMQAYIYQILADLYNEIPFSEALQGENGIKEPQYDNGQVVYDSLIARIDFALSLDFRNDELEEIGNQDLIFNGDLDLWESFANTLKLRIFLRQVNVRPAITEQGIRQMYNSEVDFLTKDAVLDLFTDESGRRNPLYETEMNFFGSNPNLILSYTFYSFLIESNDFDRLDYLFTSPSIGGTHKALEQGNYYAPEEPAGTNSSSYSKPILAPDMPVYLLSLSESNFLQAEAIMRYGLDDYDVARDLYNEGVKESYRRIFGISNVDTYVDPLLGSSYAFPSEGSSFEAFLKSIITMKWVSLSGIQNLETFFEQNRTNIPIISLVTADDNNYNPGELTVSVNNVSSGKFPRRLIFPESEYANNSNTPERQEAWVNVWWDAN
jgi:hypothetical protein